MYEFAYSAPSTIKEALDLLAEDEDTLPLAGGMTLLATMKQRLNQPNRLVDLCNIPALADIEMRGDTLVVGSMARHASVATSDLVKTFCPALANLAGNIGDPQVRNRGTIGGSVANNDPAADYPGALLALDAIIATNRREVCANDFFTGMFSTCLEPGEIIVHIRFTKPCKAAYIKFPNPASRYVIVGVFIAEMPSGTRVAVTGAGPCAFRWNEAEQALSDELSIQAVETLSLPHGNLNADIHASAEYRAHLAVVMLKLSVAAAASS